MLPESILGGPEAGGNAAIAAAANAGASSAVASASALQALLDTASIYDLDCGGANISVSSSITIPASKTLRNVTLTAATAGINVLLVNTGSKALNVSIVGTGTLSTVERAIYPAADGVTDVDLDVKISNITYGIHAQKLSSTTPKRWRGRVRLDSIVGTTGGSEGYGILLSPATDCDFEVIANDVKRHVAYMSNGASRNCIRGTVTRCGNAVVQIYATQAQSACEDNLVDLTISGMYVPGGQTAGQAVGAYILEKCNRNTITLRMVGENAAEFAVVVEGSASSGQSMPTANKIVNCQISGQFVGAEVIKDLNGEDTEIINNTIHAYGSFSVISLRRSGSPTLTQGPNCTGNHINAQGNNRRGIYNEVNAAQTYVALNKVRNNSSGTKVDDQTGGSQIGYASLP